MLLWMLFEIVQSVKQLVHLDESLRMCNNGGRGAASSGRGKGDLEK
jgi:hypothetical protein